MDKALGCGLVIACLVIACGEDEATTSSAAGGSAAGGDASGGNASGGSASGGNATGGNATGGSATGGGGGMVTPPTDCDPQPPAAGAFYVAVDGDDDTGDGSMGSPWATITHALDSVSDGDEVIVRPGDYVGRVRLRQAFASPGVVVRAEVPYTARLRNDELVVSSYGGSHITLSGFDIAHDGPGAGGLVVQIANVGTSDITLRNNVLHDSYNNDILKINNGAERVLVERNLFYNQQGSDEHIDINSVRDVVVRDNVFVNDFAASGRTNDNSTSSFIVIKDSNGSSDGVLGSTDIDVRRNVFANWQGSSGQHFVRVGEDGTANFEAIGVMVENNLMLGTTDNQIRAAFGCYGVSDVTFRNNTVVGDLPSNAFALRLIASGDNMNNVGIRYFNNIWSDPTGTMEDFSDATPGQTDTFTIDNNLYFNDGNALPEDAGELVNPSDDAAAIVGDPVIADPASAIIPTWDASSSMFTDGSATVCAAHERLVREHGIPGMGSLAIDAANPNETPGDDILGNMRGTEPDVGAFETR